MIMFRGTGVRRLPLGGPRQRCMSAVVSLVLLWCEARPTGSKTGISRDISDVDTSCPCAGSTKSSLGLCSPHRHAFCKHMRMTATGSFLAFSITLTTDGCPENPHCCCCLIQMFHLTAMVIVHVKYLAIIPHLIHIANRPPLSLRRGHDMLSLALLHIAYLTTGSVIEMAL